MTNFKTLSLLFFLIVTGSITAQSTHDSLKVLETVHLYNEGWYEGDSMKMSQALHPELVKRIVQKFKDTGNDVVNTSSYNLMIQYTIAGYGKYTPKEKQNDRVTLLDIFGNIACVKIEASDLVDYLQLAKCNGEWKIINVLWTMKSASEN